MFNYPRFKQSLDVHSIQDKYLFLLDEHTSTLLDHPSYHKITPFLNGKNSLSDIVQKSQVNLLELYTLLGSLEKRDALREGKDDIEHPDKIFVEYMQGNIHPYKNALENLRLEVRLLGNLQHDFIHNILVKKNMQPREQGNFLLVFTDDYLQPELDKINQECIQRNIPWLLVKPIGIVLWLGPIFYTPQSGCWECLAQRLRFNRQMEKYLQEHGHNDMPIITSKATLPSTIRLGVHLAILEICKYLNNSQHLVGKMQTFDLRTRKTQEHILVKRPQCSICGEKKSKKQDPLQLQSHPKIFTEDGGHRTHTPEQTYEKYKHHISPILGAVTELLPAMGVTSELTPSYVAGHNFSMGIDSILFLKEVLRGVSGGKGTTRIQAKVSGLCEAIERYSGVYHGDEYTIRSKYRDVLPNAFHPNECMGYSEKQFANRQQINSSKKPSRCVLVPEKFDESKEIDWTPGWSLTHQEYFYIPTALCYYGHPEFKEHWCFPDSNGTAAGNIMEEAILQGFMELVERDAVAIWWYNRIQRQEVDLDSFHLPYLDAIREYYESIHRTLWVLDISSDLPISTFACLSHVKNRPSQDIILGCGSHFDPKIALLRSITEVNQFLPSVSLTNLDGSTRYLFGDELAQNWWTTARLENNIYLLPKPHTKAIRASEILDLSTDDLKDDVEMCVKICKDANLNMTILDQTREDIGLNVVKVIIPQLSHFWRRLGKERLHTVALKKGWIQKQNTEEEFNPYSIFF